MAKELEKIDFIVEPDEAIGKEWRSDDLEHEIDAKAKAQEAVASLFEAVRTENPGAVEKLRISGLRKRC